MAYNIIYHPDAYIEIDNALGWYGSQSEVLAAKLLERLENALDLIIQNPYLFSCVYKNYRKINLRVFPYSIIYHFKKETVIVISFHHDKRNPKYWRKRK